MLCWSDPSTAATAALQPFPKRPGSAINGIPLWILILIPTPTPIPIRILIPIPVRMRIPLPPDQPHIRAPGLSRVRGSLQSRTAATDCPSRSQCLV